MCTQEKTVSPLPKEIAHAIALYTDTVLDQLRRNIPVTINFDELDPQSRAYVEYVAEQVLAAQRVRTNGQWCWFCGCEGRLVDCNCLYPESLRCAEHKICKECSAAHRKIANHISNLLKYPRSSRVSSRRYQGWKQLREAAEAIEEKLVAEGRLTWLTLWKWLSFLMSMTRGSVPPRNCVE
jgi:hypothetical protein